MSFPFPAWRRSLCVRAAHPVLFGLIVFSSSLSYAQTDPQQSPEIKDRHRIHILRISETIKIDGRLDEPAWSQAEAASDFRQERPTEGAPASEKTDVRVLYDSKNLYLGIRAFDSDPAEINARDLVRDSLFATDDRVEIILDTYHDRRNAFRFRSTPWVLSRTR